MTQPERMRKPSPVDHTPNPTGPAEATEPLAVQTAFQRYLVRGENLPSNFAQRLRRLGGKRIAIRKDGTQVISLPDRANNLLELAPEISISPEPMLERVRRPLRPHMLPELYRSSLQDACLLVRDSSSGRPLPGVTVVASDVSGWAAKAVTDWEGLAWIKVAPGPKTQIDVLPAAGYWPGVIRSGIRSLPGASPLELGLDRLTDLESPYTWGLDRAMKVPRVHEAGVRGAGIRVAVLDTGVYPHADLKLSGGMNTIDQENPALWQDTHWHGTHVAGIIGAVGNPGALVGVAPAAELFAVRVGKLDRSDTVAFSNQVFETDLLEGLEWCLDQRMDVVNLSLFGRQTRSLDDFFEMAYHRGMVVIAPSGNRRAGFMGNDDSSIDYPARHARVISVGAVGRMGTYPANSYFSEAEIRAEFSPQFRSYYIPEFSKRGTGLDFVAPGVAILSTVPPSMTGFDLDRSPLCGYTSWMGTSQAAPAISGLAALILEHHRELRIQKDGRRVDGVREILMKSAISLGLDKIDQGQGIPFAPACIGLGQSLE